MTERGEDNQLRLFSSEALFLVGVGFGGFAWFLGMFCFKEQTCSLTCEIRIVPSSVCVLPALFTLVINILLRAFTQRVFRRQTLLSAALLDVAGQLPWLSLLVLSAGQLQQHKLGNASQRAGLHFVITAVNVSGCLMEICISGQYVG